MSDSESPLLSVVVTVVDGRDALIQCLEALRNQEDPPAMQIVVPYDDTITDIASLAGSYPEVLFANLGKLHPDTLPLNEFSQHAVYDRRRGRGLRFAEGQLVAMIEDRAAPDSHWARAMVDLHAENTYAAVGGAIECGTTDRIRMALFFCDFGRFQPPVSSDNPEYLTDINICYRRTALSSVAPLWQDRYKEAQVNWTLRRHGHALRLSDRPKVTLLRRVMSVAQIARERIQWGRVFGQVRGAETTRLHSALWAAASPIVPTVLFIRHLRRQLNKQRMVREFVLAIPYTLLFLHCWVIGECFGYCEAAIKRRAPTTNELLDHDTPNSST